jgi:glucose-6-phosphate 1-dehydrogenase
MLLRLLLLTACRTFPTFEACQDAAGKCSRCSSGGQYTGYRSEEGVDPESDTETFVALKCSIDNWVPFFLRTGKRLAEGQRIISIAFREPPKSMFPAGSGVGAQGPDHLTFDLADAAKMSLSFYGKRPGPGMRLDKLSLQFALHETGMIGDVLEAYERLILRVTSSLAARARCCCSCSEWLPSFLALEVSGGNNRRPNSVLAVSNAAPVRTPAILRMR